MVRPGRLRTARTASSTPGHERGPVVRVVPDGQRLAGGAEEHLLVGDQPGGAHGVHAYPVDRRRPARPAPRPWWRPAPGRGRPRRGPAAISRAVCVAVPLGASSLRGWCCSMISTDSKCRAARAANCIISTAPMPKFGAITTPTPGLRCQPAAHPLEPLLGEAGGADHRVDALVDAPVQVVHDDVRGGEVDDHLGAGVGGVEQPVALVDHRHQVEVVGGVDRPAHLDAHPAAGTQHADPDRLVRALLLLVSHGAQPIPARPTADRPAGEPTMSQRRQPAKSLAPNGPTTASDIGRLSSSAASAFTSSR